MTYVNIRKEKSGLHFSVITIKWKNNTISFGYVCLLRNISSLCDGINGVDGTDVDGIADDELVGVDLAADLLVVDIGLQMTHLYLLAD